MNQEPTQSLHAKRSPKDRQVVLESLKKFKNLKKKIISAK